jgi:hypothetical protein
MINTDKYTYVYLTGRKPKTSLWFRAHYVIEIDIETNTFNIHKNRDGETYPNSHIPLPLLADFLQNPYGKYTVNELFLWGR